MKKSSNTPTDVIINDMAKYLTEYLRRPVEQGQIIDDHLLRQGMKNFMQGDRYSNKNDDKQLSFTYAEQCMRASGTFQEN